MQCWMTARASGYMIRELATVLFGWPTGSDRSPRIIQRVSSQRFGERVGIYSTGDYGADRRLNRRNSMIAAAVATAPYSSGMTHPGRIQSWPRARRCQTTYVGRMLTVHRMIGSVD